MRGVHNKDLKNKAVSLRLKGWTYPMIEKELGTPRATLSYWFDGLKLSKAAVASLLKRKIIHIESARQKALVVLRRDRAEKYSELYRQVSGDVDKIKLDNGFKELLLAMLYLGEGFKKRSCLGLGNSNPDIALMFVQLLRDIFQVEESRLRCFLHLRMDQDAEKVKKFWSKKLSIPVEQFRKTQFDKRTTNSKTWPDYHGVCTIYCYDARIEKRLTVLQKLLVKKILGD